MLQQAQVTGEQKSAQRSWRQISWWALRQQFQKTDWLRQMGSGASEHKQHVQKHSLMGRKKQRE